MQGFRHHNRMELNSANNPSEPAAVLPENLCVRGQAATPLDFSLVGPGADKSVEPSDFLSYRTVR